MKITFVLPYAGLAGGIRVVSIYADELTKRGHDVLVVSQPRQPVPLIRKVKSFLKRGKWIVDTPQASHLDDVEVKRLILDVTRPVTDPDLPDSDIVIATWWETAYWVNDLSLSKGKKVYFVQHHEVHDHLDQARSSGSYHLPLKKITIAQWLVDTMAELYGDSDVALVPNGVDTELFSAGSRSKQPRPTIGLVYSGVKFKGVDVTLAAIEQVRQRHPSLKVIAFGAGPLIDDLPLPDGSEYHQAPLQSEIPKLYSRMDVLAWGSRVEGFGLPIIEALACGTPVVSTKTGCAPDAIEEGVNGYLVDPEDVESLSSRILRIIEGDPPIWGAMSRAARKSVENLTWDHSVDLFEQTLIEAIDRTEGSGLKDSAAWNQS